MYKELKSIIKILRIIRKRNIFRLRSYQQLANYYQIDIDVMFEILPVLALRSPDYNIINCSNW